MFIHDVIKIKYVTLGFLPNYPYHLISDKEMFDAFIWYEKSVDNDLTNYIPNLGDGFFPYFYPYRPSNTDEQNNPDHYYPVNNILRGYDILIRSICKHIDKYLSGVSTEIPDWVYSYMLGNVVGPLSDKLDIHDVIKPLGTDNPDDDFDEKSAIACYNESNAYLTRNYPLPDTTVNTDGTSIRPITMFGEPHVIKSLRLKQVSLQTIYPEGV